MPELGIGQRLRGLPALFWQLAGSWVLGSVLMGTVAVIYLQALPPRVHALQKLGVLYGQLLISPAARLGMYVLVIALFVLLGMLGWRTATATWLADGGGAGGRATLLWALLVGAIGLVGWSFAAAVTFAVGWSGGTQIALAYTAGGLPFALAVAMLARPWQLNAAAVAASLLLVAGGFLITAGLPGYPAHLATLYVNYLKSVLMGSAVWGVGPVLADSV